MIPWQVSSTSESDADEVDTREHPLPSLVSVHATTGDAGSPVAQEVQGSDDEDLLLESDKKEIERATPYCAHETEADARERIHRAFLETRRYQTQSHHPQYPVLDQFFGYLYGAPHLKGAIILCHFGKRFDTVLMLEFLTHAGFPFNVIEVANSLIGLTLKTVNIMIFDFYSYLNCALAKLPKNLGLSSDCMKGFFPHHINRIQHYWLSLPHVPDREFYQEWKMNEDRRKEFDAWFKSVKNKPFDFRSQLLDYCVTDTKVLQAAALKFVNTCLRQELEMARSYDPRHLENFAGGDRLVSLGNGTFGYPKAIYPFSRQSWTLSGYASLVMAKLAIPHFPRMPILKHEDEEVGLQRSSQEEMVFLMFMKLSKYPNLQFGLTSQAQRSFVCVDREQTPPKHHTFHVDGYDAASGIVIEYLGCRWHGCQRDQCYTPSTKSHGSFYLGDARARTE